MAVIATWRNLSGNYKYNQHYPTRRGFLLALSKGKKDILDHAVDVDCCFIIRMDNIDEYRRMKHA